MRLLTLLGIAFLSLAFVSCGKEKPPPPPVIVNVPDYKPIGEGMKVHSYAMIGVAVILAVAMMSKNKNT